MQNKKPSDVKIVINGAGASALACANLFKSIGIKTKNIIMLDRKGVIYKGRDNINEWKSIYAVETKNRSLDDAIKDANCIVTDTWLSMNDDENERSKVIKSLFHGRQLGIT